MPVISTNTAANTAVRYLNINADDQSDSLAKLASGSRINRASDDAAGLAISTRIQSDVAALSQAQTNASHGISVLQTADGGAANISDILQRMKSLASQAASGTVTDTERTYIDAEFQQLIDEIDGIATSTRYNQQSLLDGTSAFGSGITVMVGSSSSDTITVTIADMDAAALSVDSLSVINQSDANAAITALDTAIDSVSKARADLGATMSRFEFRSDSIATQQENLEAANSAIADVDIASEQAKLSSAEVKTQAAVAAAAQANQMPQELLKLLQ
ncbi:flagellin [Rhodoplanes sp. TEM]|uniref:Flagellin n=1 Tax=Rhodoplanes tepidamans TaxID=200616 RepID=A0ABT5JAM2_RHOTP|nr:MULTISPECIES: flagellin [Rhodoplanes]MDC7786692.1 flagellin [Rhodoplanes tepidamans]MDC7987088.1 flagellin [Rhodoplanes sp. TEM]MDQ0356343.1 flagellin [Rhodoplanes tepidamans]